MPEVQSPHILHEGKYRLYQKPDGTLRVQYRRDDKDEDDFMEVPGWMLKLAEGLSNGSLNPLQAFNQVRKMAGSNGVK